MPLTVTLACATEGTTIYYSLEKTNDPPTHWTVYPSEGVVIPAGAPLHHSLYAQAKETAHPTNVSNIIERIYHAAPPPVANPTFNPPWGGVYSMPLTVTLACATEGTTIYYSLEKTNDPPTHWTVYPSGGVVIPAGVPLHHSLYAQAKLTADPTKVSQVIERIYHAE
jgi:hypothetical protein